MPVGAVNERLELSGLQERLEDVELTMKRIQDQLSGLVAYLSELQRKVDLLADTDEALCMELSDLTLRVESGAKVLLGAKVEGA